MSMPVQIKDGAAVVDKSKSRPGAIGKQLLPFLIGGGSGIVSTTMYALKLVQAVNHPEGMY
jgi:hypothetical protein